VAVAMTILAQYQRQNFLNTNTFMSSSLSVRDRLPCNTLWRLNA